MVAVAGMAETAHPVLPGQSLPALHVEAAARALTACGLAPADVDGVATGSMRPQELAASLGVAARWIDGTSLPNASSVMLVRHAAAAVRQGLASTVLVVLAETLRSAVGIRHVVPPPDPASWAGQFQDPFGAGPQGLFALGLVRYLEQYGTTLEQLATVPVAQRQWAHRTSGAAYRDLITVDEVLSSPLVAYPLRRLMCSATTDYGGAVVVTSADMAQDMVERPVLILGAAESAGPPLMSQLLDVTAPPCLRTSASTALGQAGLGVADLDHAMLFDGFAHCVLFELEAIGACEPGDAGAFVAAGETAPGGRLPTNTNGGFLSYRHGDMALLQEAARQVRGTSRTQVPDVETSLVLGVGPCFSGAATVVLGR